MIENRPHTIFWLSLNIPPVEGQARLNSRFPGALAQQKLRSGNSSCQEAGPVSRKFLLANLSSVCCRR
eukprot:2468397-Pyramimonas_sp.AAC.1